MVETRALALADAVMPDLLAALAGGSRNSAMLLEEGFSRAPSGGVARFGGVGGGHRIMPAKAYLGAAAGRPEAVVKIITRGGCMNVNDLRNQLTYVGREGDVEIHGAEMFGLNAALTPEEVEDTIEQWSETWRGSSKYGETLHMVVSFPIGTDRDAATKAGREFAHAAFGSGDYGDSWDHVTAAHSDTKHPHVHVIVNRRGVDYGTMLSTFKGSALNVDELRLIQAEVAERHGIEMTATPRLARGITEKALGPAAYRKQMERGIKANVHTRSMQAMKYADNAIAQHARAYDGLARVLNAAKSKDAAELVQACGDMLRKGNQIMSDSNTVRPEDFDTVGDARRMILSALQGADEAVRSERNPSERARKERELGEYKGRAALYAPDRADLQPYAKDVPRNNDLYRSDAIDRARTHGIDPASSPDFAEARVNIASAAKNAGLDADSLLARYEVGGPKEAGTAAMWAAQDMMAAMKGLGVEPERAGFAELREASTKVDAVHDKAIAEYAKAMERVDIRTVAEDERQHAVDVQQVRDRDPFGSMDSVPRSPEQEAREYREWLSGLAKEAQAAVDNSKDRPAAVTEIDAQRAFVAAVDDVLDSQTFGKQAFRDARSSLESGSTELMKTVLPDATRLERADLARTYLEARRDIADEQTKGQLRESIGKVRAEQSSAKAAELTKERSARGRDDAHEL